MHPSDLLVPRTEYPMTVQKVAEADLLTQNAACTVFLPQSAYQVLLLRQETRTFYHIPAVTPDDPDWELPYEREESSQARDYRVYVVTAFDPMTFGCVQMVLRPNQTLTVEERGKGESLFDQYSRLL